MKIVKMDTNSFWKGEAGVVGLVEDQAHTFKTKLYLKNGQVRIIPVPVKKGILTGASAPMGRPFLHIIKNIRRKCPNLWYTVLPRSTR